MTEETWAFEAKWKKIFNSDMGKKKKKPASRIFEGATQKCQDCSSLWAGKTRWTPEPREEAKAASPSVRGQPSHGVSAFLGTDAFLSPLGRRARDVQPEAIKWPEGVMGGSEAISWGGRNSPFNLCWAALVKEGCVSNAFWWSGFYWVLNHF